MNQKSDHYSSDFYRIAGLGGLSFFIILPYRYILGGGEFLRTIILVGLLVSLFLWNSFYSHKIESGIKKESELSLKHLTVFDLLYFVFVFLFLLGYQWKFLHAPVAWRGDEDYHLHRALHFQFWFFRELKRMQFIILMFSFSVCWYLDKRFTGAKYKRILLIILITTLSFIIRPTHHNFQNCFMRYPPFLLFLETLFANPFFSTSYSEFAHRLAIFVPYFIIFLFLFFTVYSLGLKSYLSYSLPVITITTPLLYYHGAIVYIEILLVLIQFWVLFKIFHQSQITPGFLFEIAVISSLGGIVKENCLPFLFTVFVFIIIKTFCERKELYNNKYLFIIRSFYLIFLPAGIYLLFRNIFGVVRPYAAHFDNLYNLGSYYTYLLAIRQQLTLPVFLISLMGFIYLLLSKKYPNALLFSLLNFFFYFVFLTAEHYEMIGYSRFMLHFLPTFFTGLVGVGVWMNKLDGRRNRYMLVAIAIVIGSNIFYSPRYFAERSNWGVYNCDTAEYYLPYPAALEYIGSSYSPNASFIATGMFYSYNFDFYIRKFNLQQKFKGMYLQGGRWYVPKGDGRKPLTLENSFRVARQEKANLLLFHNLNNSVLVKKTSTDVKFVNRFSLGTHSLDLYKLLDNPAHKE